MRKIFVALILPFFLMACPGPVGPLPPAPTGTAAFGPVLAPLAGTHVDDEALRAAWKTADAGLYVVDAMRQLGVIRDGSPQAKQIADALESLRGWLNAATDAQQAGNQVQADNAFGRARAAYLAFRAAMGTV